MCEGMGMPHIRTILAALTIALGIFSIHCESVAAGPDFYEAKRGGWFWYEKDPQPQEPVEVPPVPPPPPPVAAESHPSEQSPVAGPTPLSSAWLKDNLPRYLETAIDNPTPENVQSFLYLQRLSMDRAEAFNDAVEKVVALNPFFDETVRRPTATFAAQQLDQMAMRARQDLLRQISERAGIWFLYDSSCVMCELQVPVLQVLAGQGYVVYPVSLDGATINESLLGPSKIETSGALVNKLGVSNLPAVFLVTSEGQFELIAESVQSVTDMQNRIVLAALRAGLITQAEIDATEPVNNQDQNLGKWVKQDRVQQQLLAEADKKGFVVPQRMNEILDAAIQSGGQDVR